MQRCDKQHKAGRLAGSGCHTGARGYATGQGPHRGTGEEKGGMTSFIIEAFLLDFIMCIV